jgi:ferritin-like metal-binding protein YciE
LATELNARDLKLVQYLNEAYGKEKQLETALTADISITTDKTYRKRLQDHLKETRDHSRRIKSRIKALGGSPEEVALPGPEVVSEAASGALNLANRAVAAAKGPVHMLRGTGEQEKLLKNAKTQYWNEFEEIATYYAIETFAEFVGDKETHDLAKSIRRDEEKMARYLEKLIPRLAKSTAREEVPSALRNGGGRRRSSSKRRRSSSSSRKSSASSRGGSSSSSSRKSSSSRSRSTKSAARTTAKSARKTAKSAGKTAKSAAKTARTSAKAASTAAKRSRAGAKGGSARKSTARKSGSRSSNGRSSASRTRAKSGSR